MAVASSAGSPWPGVFWTILILFVIAGWFWLLYVVFGDLFARPDLGRWAKAVWAAALVLLPFLGAFAYLVARGRGTARRRRGEAR